MYTHMHAYKGVCNTYSNLSHRLVIALTCELVIIDTVECKFLLIKVNKFDLIG